MLLPQLARKCMVYVLIGVMHLGFVPLSVFADGAVSWTINATSTIVEKSDLTATNYTCDPAFSACKFNIKFSDIRPSIKSHHNCIIDFGFTTQVRQNDCDPTEVQVPVGSWPVTIIVTNIDTSVEVLRLRPFTVTRAPEISIPEVFTPIDFSPISVTVDSGLDATNTCKTETCQVNLTLNPLPSNDTVCVWDF